MIDNNINFLHFGTIDIDKIVPLIIKYLRAKEDDIDFTKFGFLGNWREHYKKNSSIPITYDYEYTMIRYVKRGKRSSEQQNILDKMHYANERHDIIYGVRDKLIDKKQREEEHITYDKRIERESQEEEDISLPEIKKMLAKIVEDRSINYKSQGEGFTLLDNVYDLNRHKDKKRIIQMICNNGGKANYYNSKGKRVGKGKGNLNYENY